MAAATDPINVDEISSNAADHCTVLQTLKNGKRYKCNYCPAEFSGSGTRCYIHLTGNGSDVAQCSAVSEQIVTVLKAAKAKKDAERNQKRKAEKAAEQRRARRVSAASVGSAPAAAAGGGARLSQQDSQVCTVPALCCMSNIYKASISSSSLWAATPSLDYSRAWAWQ
jgi:hypothetical protein